MPHKLFHRAEHTGGRKKPATFQVRAAKWEEAFREALTRHYNDEVTLLPPEEGGVSLGVFGATCPSKRLMYLNFKLARGKMIGFVTIPEGVFHSEVWDDLKETTAEMYVVENSILMEKPKEPDGSQANDPGG